MSSKLKIIEKLSDVDKLIRHCETTGTASIDFETNGKPLSSPFMSPTILGVTFQPGSAWVVPLNHFEAPKKFRNNWKEVLKDLGDGIAENPAITKIAWNLSFETGVFLKFGTVIRGRAFDAMLAKYLLDENTLNDLETNVRRFLPEFGDYKQQPGFKKLPWDRKPLIPLSEYCGKDCDSTLQLQLFLEPRLMETGLYPLFRNMLCMGTRVISNMENQGVVIDVPYLQKLVDTYDALLTENTFQLTNHPTIKRFDKNRLEGIKNAFIENITQEISEVNKKLKAAPDRRLENKLKNLSEKKRNYILGNYSTKKDKEALEPFNFASPKQLKDLLFYSPHGFKFKPLKFTEKKDERRMKVQTDNPSTDEEVLLKLSHKDKSGFIKNLLRNRELSKLQSTYIRGMLNKVEDDNRIHGRFLLHGTVTGRLSSREPNLQNIPRDTTSKDIKKMFITPPGTLILQLDYSQAELRVMAAAAGETTMIEWFRTGKDIHLATACKKFNTDYNVAKKMLDDESHKDHKLWKSRRKQAKTINFGIIYGQGAPALSESLSDPEAGVYVSKAEAQKFLDDFDRLFPKVASYIKKQHRDVKVQGYVKSVFGRKRRLPGIYSNVFGIKSKAQRDAINAPIQGAASDYALFSSIIIFEKIVNKTFKGMVQILTVHDSLIFYIKPKYIHKYVPQLEAICKNPQTKKYFNFQIDDVTMQVDFEVGKNWAELHKYNPNEDYTKWV